MTRKIKLKTNTELFKNKMFFHGSNHIIKSFSDEFVGQGIDAFGPGIYFAKDIDLAEKFGTIMYSANISNFKALDNNKKPNKTQLLKLIKNAEDWEMTIQNWGENINLATNAYISELSKHSEREAFEQVWADFYRHDPVKYVRSMVAMGFGGSIRTDDNTEVYIIFDPKLIEIIEIKKINESKMCGVKKDCSCGCSIIKESLKTERVSEDILSIQAVDDSTGDTNILDIEKYPHDEFSIVINEDFANQLYFDSFNSLIQFIGNGDNITLKKMFFNDVILDQMVTFGYGEDKPELIEKVNQKDSPKLIVDCTDSEGTLSDLINYIGEVGNGGHGFTIVVDPDDAEYKKEFYWDGDGGDRIGNVKYSDSTKLEEYEQPMYDHPQTPSLDESDANYYKATAAQLKKNGYDKEAMKMQGKAEAAAEGKLVDGEFVESVQLKESKEVNQIISLFKKFYKLNKKFTKASGDKFMGFNKAETKIYQDANQAKLQAWDLGRKSNLDTNEIMNLDMQAKKAIMKEAVTGSDLTLWNKLKTEDATEMDEIFDELKTRAEKKVGRPVINLQDVMIALEISDPDYKLEKLDEAKKVNLKITSNTKRELIKNVKVAQDSIYNVYNTLEKLGIEANSFTGQLDDAFTGINNMMEILIGQKSIDKK